MAQLRENESRLLAQVGESESAVEQLRVRLETTISAATKMQQAAANTWQRANTVTCNQFI